MLERSSRSVADGKPQNEIKHGQKGMFEELDSDLPRLEQFIGARRSGFDVIPLAGPSNAAVAYK